MRIETIRTTNLKQLVEMNGGVTRFSEKIGKKVSQVSQWLNNSIATLTGKPSYISSRSCRQIEKILELPEAWMDVDHDGNVVSIGTQETVPLISWVAAGNWTPMADQSSDFQQVMCPFPHGKGTFALEVRGVSMENPNHKPSFSNGDWIYVDPTREAHHRDFVVVRLDDEAEATFKQLQIEDGKKFLFALNPDWKPRIMPINGNSTLIGVVIGKVERW